MGGRRAPATAATARQRPPQTSASPEPTHPVACPPIHMSPPVPQILSVEAPASRSRRLSSPFAVARGRFALLWKRLRVKVRYSHIKGMMLRLGQEGYSELNFGKREYALHLLATT